MNRQDIQTGVELIVKDLYPQDDGSVMAENLPVLGTEGVLDSVLGLQLLLRIEEKFGIVVTDDEIDGANLSSLGSISRFIERKLTMN
jgi:acyl carrier protein